MKTNCSLTETCNFVGRINKKPNEEATQFTNTSSINTVYVETYSINLKVWKYRTLQWHETTYKIRESTRSSSTGVQYKLSWLVLWRCSNDSPNPPKSFATYPSPPCFLSLWCPVAAHAKLLGIRWTNTTASRIYRCPIWRMGSME
jgi:hypothetical protein